MQGVFALEVEALGPEVCWLELQAWVLRRPTNRHRKSGVWFWCWLRYWLWRVRCRPGARLLPWRFFSSVRSRWSWCRLGKLGFTLNFAVAKDLLNAFWAYAWEFEELESCADGDLFSLFGVQEGQLGLKESGYPHFYAFYSLVNSMAVSFLRPSLKKSNDIWKKYQAYHHQPPNQRHHFYPSKASFLPVSQPQNTLRL